MSVKRNTLLFLFIYNVTLACGFWSWFSSSTESSTKAIDYSMGSSSGKLANVPFEMLTKDEKFLLEAEKFGLVMSNLDVCHHKVMLHLKKSCSAMSEEEIAKVSVLLFNCQSAVEGRQTFPCTDEMTLAQCTQDMDKSTWNAYHIMSNRARSVCYAARQQQFVAKTEMAVNKLVFTADHQIEALEKIEDGQMKVKELTSQTLETMHAGQRELVERQEKLKTSQQTIQAFVSGNLRELTREKSLIAAGQKELAMMTELIQQKLDEASLRLNVNEVERQNNHQEILKDLGRVQNKAKEMWDKIDNSTQRILKQHVETAMYYQGTLNNLEKINETVTYLLQLVDQTRSEVDSKLGWLSGILDGAGLKLTVIYCCVVHGLYFLVAAVAATFLQVPSFSRIFMSMVIPINALCDANQMTCFDFSSLTVVLVTTVLAHWVTCTFLLRKPLDSGGIMHAITERVKTLTPPRIIQTEVYQHLNGNYPGLSPAGARELHVPDADMSGFSSDLDISHFDANPIISSLVTPGSSTPHPDSGSGDGAQISQVSVQGVRRDLLGVLDDSRSTHRRSVTPTRRLITSNSRAATPVRSSPGTSGLAHVTSPKKLCAGCKRSGSPCRAAASAGRDFCHRHLQISE